MKRILIYFKQIIIIGFLLLSYQNELLAQNNDTIKRVDTIKKIDTIRKIEIIKSIKPGLFIGFSAGLSQTSIKNVGALSISQLVSSPQNSYTGSFELGYLFSRYFGLSSGVNYVSYKSQLALSAYQNSYSTIDSEGDAFEMKVIGTDIKESQSVDLLYVPLCVTLKLPFGKKVGMFFKGGVGISFPLSQKYTSNGTFTYKGFYPAYNDLLENLPAYGFPTNKSVTETGLLKLKAVGISPVLSTGLDSYISKKIQFALGFSLNNTVFSTQTGSTLLDKFQLSPDADHINSVSGGSSKITAQSIGFEFSLRFYM